MLINVFNTLQLLHRSNHEEIASNQQRIKKIKPFINKYNWKGINHSSGKVDWKRFEKNNPTIVLNMQYVKNTQLAYSLNCAHLFRTNNKLERKDFRGIIMPSKDTKILEFNPYQKSDKAPSIIYADLESLIKRMDGCKNNFEETSTTKVG